jgi:hypothetical protein
MKQLTQQYLKFLMIKLCLIGVLFISISSDAWAECAIYTMGAEQSGPKYPDHPSRYGVYFYVGHPKEAIFNGEPYCGSNSNFSVTSMLKNQQKQIDDTYAKFAGCEANDDIKNCQRNYRSPSYSPFFDKTSDTASMCGAGFKEGYKYGRFYYCADGNMVERTDFIPVVGCAPNTYAGTDKCQPCPEGKYSPKGSVDISQCVDAKANEAVWAISQADNNGFFSCPKGANMNGRGNCSCVKGKNWKSNKKQCV